MGTAESGRQKWKAGTERKMDVLQPNMLFDGINTGVCISE